MATARKPPSRVVLKSQTEKSFEGFVKRTAHRFGWCGFHISFSHGAVTGVHAFGLGDDHMDSDGWPDWVFVRERVIYRELKAEGKYQTPQQKRWMAKLLAAGQDCKVWKPTDLDEVVATFRGDVT
jgi:hypothetical protein